MSEQNKAVTPEMMDAAMTVLSQLGVGRISRKIENRDIVFEVLEAVAKVGTRVSTGTYIKDEAGWAEFFKQCYVIVNDAGVGQAIFQKGLESAGAFKELIGTISKHGAIAVPLLEYPGVALFRDVVEPTKRASKQTKE